MPCDAARSDVIKPTLNLKVIVVLIKHIPRFCDSMESQKRGICLMRTTITLRFRVGLITSLLAASQGISSAETGFGR